MVAGASPAPYHPPPPGFCGARLAYQDDTSSSEHPSGMGAIPAFFNGIMGPFMACWQPPFEACASSSQPMNSPVTVSPMSIDSPYSLSPQSSSVVALTSNIRTPHANDVLCGRGGSSNRHVGNHNFRALVAANKETYVTLTKKQKMMMARVIVGTVRGQDPPGRFLQKDTDTGLWSDIGMPRSLEKTSQALREKSSSSDRDPISPESSVADDHPDDEARSPSPVVAVDSSPVTPTSSPVVPVSPVVSPKSRKSAPPPALKIPEHLEAQFHPHVRRQHYNGPRPPAPIAGGWQPMVHSAHQPYPPNFHGNVDPSTRPSPYASGHMHQYSYRQPADTHQYGLAPHLLNARQPHHGYPQPLPVPSTTIPPSPPRSMAQDGSTRMAGPVPLSRHGNRKGHRISPGSQQDSKRRRQKSPSANAKSRSSRTQAPSHSLIQDMQVCLSLKESEGVDKELTAPSQIIQSRSRPRSSAKEHSGDALAGLAALSSAALLKLDENEI